ncbi:MAG: hypothetical protein ACPGUE_09785 [Marinomonas sp.]
MLSSFASAIIGGLFVLVGVISTHWLNERKQRKDKINRDIRLLKAFKSDLMCLFGAYMASAGNSVDACRKDDFVELEYKAEQDYFAFFHENASHLSDFSNSDIGLKINVCYVTFKGLLDTFSLHTEMINMYVGLQLENMENGDKDKQIEVIANQLRHYSPKLIEHHDEAIRLYNEVAQELNTEVDALLIINTQSKSYEKPMMLVGTLLLLALLWA